MGTELEDKQDWIRHRPRREGFAWVRGRESAKSELAAAFSLTQFVVPMNMHDETYTGHQVNFGRFPDNWKLESGI